MLLILFLCEDASTDLIIANHDCFLTKSRIERDQPLWCYVLEHEKLTPIPLDHEHMFRLNISRMGTQKHKYGKNSDNAARSKLEKQPAIPTR